MGEKLVAGRGVRVDRQLLDVRISRHADEHFWRVDVSHPLGRAATGAALDGDDNFLSRLASSAVAGEGSAWEDLARWGHDRLSRPGW